MFNAVVTTVLYILFKYNMQNIFNYRAYVYMHLLVYPFCMHHTVWFILKIRPNGVPKPTPGYGTG